MLHVMSSPSSMLHFDFGYDVETSHLCIIYSHVNTLQ